MGTSALAAACVGGSQEAIGLLIEAGATESQGVQDGGAMLIRCAQTGTAETMQALLDRGDGRYHEAYY